VLSGCGRTRIRAEAHVKHNTDQELDSKLRDVADCTVRNLEETCAAQKLSEATRGFAANETEDQQMYKRLPTTRC
jgi:hypothetical protein